MTCKNVAGANTDHLGFGRCSRHGGSSPTHVKAAHVQMVEAEARKLLDIEGNRQLLSDPYTELASLMSEVLSLKNVLRERVEELTTLKDIGGEKVATQIDVIMSAYERALDRAERLLLGVSRLALDDKIAALNARVDSATADLVSHALSQALVPLALDQTQHADVLRLFGEMLRQPLSQKVAITA